MCSPQVKVAVEYCSTFGFNHDAYFRITSAQSLIENEIECKSVPLRFSQGDEPSLHLPSI
jgi:hypothetical protein